MTSLHDPPRCVKLKSRTPTSGCQTTRNQTLNGRIHGALVDVWLGYTPTRQTIEIIPGTLDLPDGQTASPQKISLSS
jgi:hypothetical protein